MERAHLRLAPTPSQAHDGGRPRRRALLARAWLIRLWVTLGNAAAFLGAAAALLPVLLRRGPRGRRHVPRPAPRLVVLSRERRAGAPR